MAVTHSLDLEASSSQYAYVADAADIDFGTGDFCVEGWIKLESVGVYQGIISKLDASDQDGFRLNIDNNNTVGVHTADGGLVTSLNTTATLSSGVWNHIAFVRSSTSLLIYINGELSASTTGTVRNVDNTNTLAIGLYRSASVANLLDGLIRNVRVWNDARTQSEIRANMNIDTPTDTTGLVRNWILNNSYTDAMGNADLTASGSPVFATAYPDALDLTENSNWTKKHKITIDADQVSGSADLTDVPIVLTEDNFLADVWDNTQEGSEINVLSLLSDANLEAYYRFENGALTTDSSGDGETLTNTGTAADGTGKFGGAGDLGASNNSKYFSRASNLGIDGGAITIAGWVKLNTEIGSGTYDLMSQSSTTTRTDYHIAYEYNSGTRRLSFKRDKGGVASQSFEHTITLGTSNWYHLALTYDATTVKGYVNGQYVGSVAASGNGTDAGTPNRIAIGVYSYDLAAHSSALFDDVAYFSRALTDNEVKIIAGRGKDLRFSTDIDGKNRLAHEVVSWDLANSTGEIWVKINTLDYDNDTDIYVHYGNSSAKAIDENAAFGKHQVWPSNWKFIHHASDINDSTKNSADLTNVGTTDTGGKIGRARHYTKASKQYASRASYVPHSGTGAFTILTWVKFDTLNDAIQYVLSWNASGQIPLLVHDGSVAASKVFFEWGGGTGRVTNGTALSTGTWYQVAVVYNGTTVKIYLNGAEDGSTNYNASNIGTGGPFALGQSSWDLAQAYSLNGDQDETRIYNGALSADYIATLYNNQNSPSTFAIPVSGFIPKVIFI